MTPDETIKRLEELREWFKRHGETHLMHVEKIATLDAALTQLRQQAAYEATLDPLDYDAVEGYPKQRSAIEPSNSLNYAVEQLDSLLKLFRGFGWQEDCTLIMGLINARGHVREAIAAAPVAPPEVKQSAIEPSDRQGALYDSAYIAGAKAGHNAAQSDDPEALNKLIATRAGYLKALATPEVVPQGVFVPQEHWDWLMGLAETFEPPPEYKLILGMMPKFWWRSELRKRVGLQPRDDSPESQSSRSAPQQEK